MKNYQDWFKIKNILNSKEINKNLFFYEREVWWCSLGENIGVEADGKNEIFERPVLIVKKFNSDMVWCLPMTSKEKIGKHYIEVKHEKGVSYVNMSQLRTVSVKRLQRKIGMIDAQSFNRVVKRLVEYLETSNPPFGGFSEAEATNNLIIANTNKLSN